MPDFPIVDTHVHLSDQKRISYSWMADVPELSGSYSLDDYDAARASVDVAAMVFMEVDPDADDCLREVEWITQLAASDQRVLGVVAKALVGQGAGIDSHLETLARNPLVKGVRYVFQSEDADYCVRPSFLEGLRLLPQHGLTFDICTWHPHLANVIKMVEACPEVQFVLDHIGKPGIKDQLFEPWKTQIRALAALPNVCCKISGVATEADHENWMRDDVRPYLDHVIDCFSFDRVMFGSDWFVAKLASTIERWVETVDWAVAGCSDAELRKLYVENAQAFYRLEEEK